jgi:hypothetical protein
VGIRDRLRRLQRAAQVQLEYIELEDGTRYWYDPAEVGTEVFMHGVDSLQADFAGEPRPGPPEIMVAIARARDRRTALEAVFEEPWKAFIAFDLCVLIERGELVPRSMVAGKEYGEPLEDLSE